MVPRRDVGRRSHDLLSMMVQHARMQCTLHQDVRSYSCFVKSFTLLCTLAHDDVRTTFNISIERLSNLMFMCDNHMHHNHHRCSRRSQSGTLVNYCSIYFHFDDNIISLIDFAIRLVSPMVSTPSPYRRRMVRYFLSWIVPSISRMILFLWFCLS